MIQTSTSVLEIVTKYNKLKENAKEVENALIKLRGKDFLDDIDKDERISIKLLYNGYREAIAEYEAFIDIQYIPRPLEPKLKPFEFN